MRKITSLQHPLVKHLVKLKKESSYRVEKQSLIIEGSKMILELPSKIKIKSLLITKECDAFASIPAISTYHVSVEILNKISALKNNEGILAEIELPTFKTLEENLQGCDHLLALDSISDPGNLGGLLRSAAAFGFENIFLLNNCVDPFNDKALRAAKGATFQLTLSKGTWDDLKKMILQLKLPVFVADTKGQHPNILAKQKQAVLIMGSEAHGPSIIPDDVSATTISIPTSQKVESLNVGVAGAILMYLMKEHA